MASTNFLNDNQEGLRHWETPPSVARRKSTLSDALHLLNLPDLTLPEAVRATEQLQLAKAAPVAESVYQPVRDEQKVVNSPAGQPEPGVSEINTAAYGEPLNVETIRQSFEAIYGGSQN